jgi:hypothetical protein
MVLESKAIIKKIEKKISIEETKIAEEEVKTQNFIILRLSRPN